MNKVFGNSMMNKAALFFQPFCGNERNWIFQNLEFSEKFLEFRQKILEFSRKILEFGGKWLGFKFKKWYFVDKNCDSC